MKGMVFHMILKIGNKINNLTYKYTIMITEKLISSIDNANGTTSKKYTAHNYNILYIGIVLFLSISTYGILYWKGNALQMCQESYMKATNEIVRYNEDNPDYIIPLPEYNCNEVLLQLNASGSKVPPPSEISKLSIHQKICNKQMHSPLCKDKELLAKLYKITEDRLPWKNMFPILIGIANAESSLGLDFANDNIWGKCYGRNNWGGTKYQILDNNTRVYKRNLNWFVYENSVDQYGCNLYPFESIEEFWITKVNGMRFGYKSCVESEFPIKCISYAYVGNPYVSEKVWVKNVAEFVN